MFDPTRPSSFPETQWSLVLRLRLCPEDEGGQQALAALCEAYWQPLYAYVRRSGCDPDTARDVVQGFLMHLIVNQRFVRAEEAKGRRLRYYLMRLLGDFLKDGFRRQNALKRGGQITFVSFDVASEEAIYLSDLKGMGSVEEAFDRRWAQTVLTRAMDRLREGERTSKNEAVFQALMPTLLSPTQITEELSQSLNMTPNTLRVTIHRLRRKLRDLVLGELAETVGSHADLDDELEHFLRMCS